MGSVDFYETHTNPNVQTAYNALVDEATREYGTDGYNGTISTTHGCSVLSQMTMTASAAEQFAREQIDTDRVQKWGSCGAVKVGKPTKTKTRTLTKTITLSEDGRSRSGLVSGPLSDYEAARLLGLEDCSVEVLEQSPFTVTPKLVKEKTAGKGTKRWGLFYGANPAPFSASTLVSAHASRAEARKAMADQYTLPLVPSVTDRAPTAVSDGYRIEPFIEDKPSETWRVENTVKVKVKVRVTEAAPNSPLEFSHWLFFGIAAC